ncbi:MAG TPA: T9SS type A sorting domain-containing protein [Salinimicrobium sp.]|nr:T9SS type A sorting domain-containing protein [Salinimicrobium sp.]
MMKKITFLLVFISFFHTTAQTWEQIAKVTPENRYADDYFGFRVLIKNDSIITGAYRNDYNANEAYDINNAGSVYIFSSQGDEWTQEQKLVASDRQVYNEFGREFELSGNNLFITARRRSIGSTYDIGAVYVFKKDVSGNWIENQIIEPNTLSQYTYFGNKISVDQNFLAVGSESENVSVFKFNNSSSSWEFEQELVSANGNTYDSDVSVLSGKIFVGKRYQEINGFPEVGQVYIYEENGTTNEWEIVQTINPPTIQEDIEFGATIFSHNDFLFVQAANLHTVYVYQWDNSSGLYEYNQEISGGSGFGVDMAAEENTLVVGSYLTNNGTYIGGSAYIYKLENGLWESVAEIANEDQEAYDYFGSGVSIDNGTVVVGAPFEDLDSSGNDYLAKAGAFYVFEDTSTMSNNSINVSVGVKIFPNPFLGSIAVELGRNFPKVELNVYNISGSEILSKHYANVNQVDLELSDLASGFYVLKIYSGNTLLKTTKLLKQ